MRLCFWLEDQVGDWPEVSQIAKDAGMALKVFEHPDEMRDAITDVLNSENPPELCLLIDLIIGGCSHFTDWNGQRVFVHGNNGGGATEVGFSVLEMLICGPNSPVSEKPISILTQRSDDGYMSQKLETIKVSTNRSAPIELFEKIDLDGPESLLKWMKNPGSAT